MYEIYSLYLINENEKKALYMGMENHQDHYLKTIAKERLEVSKYFDRYVIVGVLKGNKDELEGYKILDPFSKEWEEYDKEL